MEIEFVSGQNHMMPGDPEIHLAEIEDLEYMGTVKPDGDAYKLVLTSRGDTTDENRLFLKQEFKLVEEGAPSNIVQFAIMDGNKRIGRFYFSYYPNTEYKTFQVCLEFIKNGTVFADLLIVLKRLRHFKITA